VQENWELIIAALFQAAHKAEEFDEIMSLFNSYGLNYESFIQQEKHAELVQDSLADYVNRETELWVRDKHASILNEENWDDLKRTIEKKRATIYDKFAVEDNSYDQYSYFDDEAMNDLIETNIANKKKTGQGGLVNNHRYTWPEDEKMVKEIEELFAGEIDTEFVMEKAESLGLPF